MNRPAPSRRPQAVQCRYASPLGPMRLAATPQGLCGLWFDGQQHRPDAWLDSPSGPALWPEQPDHPLLRTALAQLDAYWSAARPFDLPLDLGAGTGFQQQVWQALRALAPGATCSYGQLALRLGKPQAVRAVGAAIGRNPVSLIVPCHRVLGGQGRLTGYAGGLDRKAALLRHEGASGWRP